MAYEPYPTKFPLHLNGFTLIHTRIWRVCGLHGNSPLQDNTNATSLHSQAGNSHRQRNACLEATLEKIHFHVSQIHQNRWHRHPPLSFATKALLPTTILIHSQHQSQISLTLSSSRQRVAISSTTFQQASIYPSQRRLPFFSSLRISTPFLRATAADLRRWRFHCAFNVEHTRIPAGARSWGQR